MILVRTTRLSGPAARFGAELQRESGLPVGFIVDGRHAPEAATELPVVLLTEAACRARGLYCPPTFQWRCGDYGLYLARAAFPAVEHFWLIEHDIRLGGGPVAGFFAAFPPEPDFLACGYRPAERDWSWYPFARGRGVVPHRCLFGIVRLSAPALDVLLARRIAQGRSALRRAMWPNDESFVATTLTALGRDCRDIAAFGTFYDDSTLHLYNRIRGETFDPPPIGVRIYHPVLFGDDYLKGNTTAGIKETFSLRQRAVRKARKALVAVSAW